MPGEVFVNYADLIGCPLVRIAVNFCFFNEITRTYPLYTRAQCNLLEIDCHNKFIRVSRVSFKR